MTVDHRTIDSLAERFRAADLETDEGLRLALDIISELGATADPAVVPFLFPLLSARAWPGPRAAHDHHVRLADAACAAAEKVIATMSVSDLVGLDQRLRARSRWYRDPRLGCSHEVRPNTVRHLVDSSGVDSSGVDSSGSPTLAGLLAGHPNGHVREAAVAELHRRGVEALPWLLLRTIDWVHRVRFRAIDAVISLMHDENAAAFVDALPLAQRLTRFTRVDQRPLVERIEAFLDCHIEAVETGQDHPDRLVRRAALELLQKRRRITTVHLSRAFDDSDTRVRLMAARMLVADDTPEMVRLRTRASNDKLGRIRVIGLELIVAAEASGALSRLEDALEDPNRGVRALAQHHLSRSQPERDFAEHYRRLLEKDPPSPAAVCGLAGLGAPEDWERLVPLLDRGPKLARAALRALKALDRKHTRELRLMMVDDPRAGVSKDAAASLRGELWSTDVATIEEYLASPIEHVRRNAVRLAAQLHGWKPALLLLALSDPSLAERANAQLERWLGERRSTIAAPSRSESRELRRLLGESTLILESTKAQLEGLLDFIAPGADSSGKGP